MNLRMTKHFSSGVDVLVLGCVVGNSMDWSSVNARIHLSSGLHSTVLIAEYLTTLNLTDLDRKPI